MKDDNVTLLYLDFLFFCDFQLQNSLLVVTKTLELVLKGRIHGPNEGGIMAYEGCILDASS